MSKLKELEKLKGILDEGWDAYISNEYKEWEQVMIEAMKDFIKKRK